MAAHSRLPQVGDVFGRYRVDAQIGRGGMGVVFRATDTVIDRTVALKVISAALGDAGDFRLRFEREAAVLARLASPHVIEIYDYGTQDDCPYIATQYVGGGDLGALLHERGPMPPTLALKVCAQMADALGDAHRVGVVHRDVKPTNVLLRDADDVDMHALLCDFGIARTTTDGLTAPGAVAGTWSYLAPECGRGAPGTPSSDIYALGCLLWATLTGGPPYRGADVEIAVAHQRAPIPQLEGADELSSRVNAILRHTMAKEPRDRYPDADALRADLLAAAGVPDSGIRPPLVIGDPSTAPTARPGSSQQLSLGSLPPRSSPHNTPPGGRRSRLTVALVSVAVLAVAGGVVGVTTLARDAGSTPAAGGSAGLSSDPNSGDATATANTTEDTTPPPTDGPIAPVRLDQGGPITGDLDGDGLGDLRLDYSLVSRTDDHSGDFSDVTDWTSDGTAFVKGRTVEATTRKARYDQGITGDFDGDSILETLNARTNTDDRTSIVLTGDLSGGGAIDTTFDTLASVAFMAPGDLDGDGSDDLRLLYVGDINDPSRIASVLLDGNQTRTTAPLSMTFPPYGDAAYTAGDYDGDGLDDVALLRRVSTGPEVTDYYSELALWFNDGNDGLRRGPTDTVPDVGYLAQVLSADIDGDEDAEVVVVGDSGVGEITGYDVRGRALRRPEQLGAFRSLGQDSTATVSDVDGDGLDDIVALAVLSDESARLLVARGDGKTLTVSRWGTWERTFNNTKVGTYLSTEGGPFS